MTVGLRFPQPATSQILQEPAKSFAVPGWCLSPCALLVRAFTHLHIESMHRLICLISVYTVSRVAAGSENQEPGAAGRMSWSCGKDVLDLQEGFPASTTMGRGSWWTFSPSRTAATLGLWWGEAGPAAHLISSHPASGELMPRCPLRGLSRVDLLCSCVAEHPSLLSVFSVSVLSRYINALFSQSLSGVWCSTAPCFLNFSKIHRQKVRSEEEFSALWVGTSFSAESNQVYLLMRDNVAKFWCTYAIASSGGLWS